MILPSLPSPHPQQQFPSFWRWDVNGRVEVFCVEKLQKHILKCKDENKWVRTILIFRILKGGGAADTGIIDLNWNGNASKEDYIE